MASSTINWEASWTNTTINGSSVTNAGNATSAAISLDDKWAVEVSVTIAYGGTATQGVRVFVLRDVDGTNYEASGDSPWGFAMPYGVSATKRRAFTLSAHDVASFKVYVTNDSGATVTATVRYRYASAVDTV